MRFHLIPSFFDATGAGLPLLLLLSPEHAALSVSTRDLRGVNDEWWPCAGVSVFSI